VRLLLERGAKPNERTRYGTVGEAALWRAAHGGNPDRSAEIVDALMATGAKLPDRHPPVNEQIDALLSRYGSLADSSRYWWGEEPRPAWRRTRVD
jgi:hypothetical protein